MDWKEVLDIMIFRLLQLANSSSLEVEREREVAMPVSSFPSQHHDKNINK